MIHVVLGTKAQLVKMAPVMARLRERGVAYRFVHTGQHQETMSEMLEQFGLDPPDVVLHRGGDVVTPLQTIRWFASILARCLFAHRRVFGGDRRGIVLVHGDTLSTLLGALMGRIAGLRVGHVESGLRSFHLFHPFPEEITRLLTLRLSHVLYCPGAWAMGNAQRFGRERIDTEVNTLSDALALSLRVARRSDHVPRESYALVSLHRYENVFDRARLAWLVQTVEEIARERLVLFVLHPPTQKQLERTGLRARLEANPRVELRPRIPYFDFVSLLERAELVATDGGSLQEECSYLGVPCLLLRRATERREGLGVNAVLSRYDPELIRDFLSDPGRWRSAPTPSRHRPSEIIVESVLPFA
jgi:UDP-N-acetylglucosamine 2-epimerase (non-hydrolysing)